MGREGKKKWKEIRPHITKPKADPADYFDILFIGSFPPTPYACLFGVRSSQVTGFFLWGMPALAQHTQTSRIVLLLDDVSFYLGSY